MATCDTNTLLSSASCFSCLPRGFFRPLKLVLLSKILEAKGGTVPDIATLLERGECFSCLSDGQMAVLRLALLCQVSGGNEWYVSYSSSGGNYIDADPNVDVDPVV